MNAPVPIPDSRPLLVVDDQAPVRALIVHSVRAMGYETVEASDGVEALERLKTIPVRAVLCDIRMPRLDGAGFLEQVRQVMSRETLPFIMISGEDDRDTVTQLLALGANDYIIKPFSQQTLRMKLGAVLGEPPPPAQT